MKKLKELLKNGSVKISAQMLCETATIFAAMMCRCRKSKGERVKYVSNLDEFNLKRAPRNTLLCSNEIPHEVIEKAKEEAIDKDIPEGYGVK